MLPLLAIAAIIVYFVWKRKQEQDEVQLPFVGTVKPKLAGISIFTIGLVTILIAVVAYVLGYRLNSLKKLGK